MPLILFVIKWFLPPRALNTTVNNLKENIGDPASQSHTQGKQAKAVTAPRVQPTYSGVKGRFTPIWFEQDEKEEAQNLNASIRPLHSEKPGPA